MESYGCANGPLASGVRAPRARRLRSCGTLRASVRPLEETEDPPKFYTSVRCVRWFATGAARETRNEQAQRFFSLGDGVVVSEGWGACRVGEVGSGCLTYDIYIKGTTPVKLFHSVRI